MSKKLSLLGYLILFTFIFFLISSFFKDQLIYIEAGPKGGFFDTSANVLTKRLKDYNINAEVINREDTIKIVDDINDSGTTFKVISDVFRDKRLDFKTAAIINKKSSHFTVDFFGEMFYYDDWINFPWENK